MKNPFPIFLIVAALFFVVGFKMSFIIPAIILYVIFKANQNKNNRNPQDNQSGGTGRGYDPYQRRREQPRQAPRREYEQRRSPNPPPKPRQQSKPRPKQNPFKNSGVEKYKDFDYEGAIEDFKKAIEIDSNDIPTHFNIACAYSLTEQKDLAFKHLDRAVSLGYKDFEKLKSHDAFAYIRIQNDFDTFEQNGFRLTAKMDIPQDDESVDPLLLERLRKLSELKDRGILTQEEFLIQKEKLLR
ncbi:MAG: tetratricopeptide (TPR) repeat protein [Saprospiraceae bacterium]|jgi:tetratricopeptide (TPR) repeat protein